ncbi:hypothetical protein DFH08DRAFT_847241, partial [Mycena albidolilacea]
MYPRLIMVRQNLLQILENSNVNRCRSGPRSNSTDPVTNILPILPSALSHDVKSDFALEWRQTYFDANTARIRNGDPPEDIDITHRRTLLAVLDKHPEIKPLFTQDVQEKAVAAWHEQKAWPDVAEALRKLKEERELEIYVHANGKTRLQLDILLGCYKPAPENYRKVLG